MTQKKKQSKYLPLLALNVVIVLLVYIALTTIGKYQVVSVDAIALNVRTGPGVEYDVTRQVRKGDKLTVTDEENQWYQVSLHNKPIGWVASWLLDKGDSSPPTNINAFVNTADTKLRADGSLDSQQLLVLPKGTKVTITLEKNGWSQVSIKGTDGWISSDLLTVENTEDHQKRQPKNGKLYARQDDTKIRATPDIESEIITTLNYGDSVRYQATTDDWFEVQTSSGQTGYVANWVVSFDSLDKKKRKPITSIAEATVVLDPGHGGRDVGAESNDERIYEKNITLATAHYVEKELKKQGANVILTRGDDRFVPLAEIAAISNRANANVFISFHYDSTENSNEASGTTTYYRNVKNIPLAKVINKQLKKNLPIENRGIEYADYQVLRDNNQPALLLELGYMNNDDDVAYFKTKRYQRLVAKSIKQGLIEYFEH